MLWVVVASGLVFMMQAGFEMLESGLTRSKNSINVSIKNLTDLGISVLCFWAAGFAIMFGASRKGFAGTTYFGFTPNFAWGAVFLLFQTMFCSTSATIVSGAVAERMRYFSYIIETVIMSLVIYPVFGHWAWGGAMEGAKTGLLNSRGFVDFAGCSVVHSVGGWVSLAALLIIGPRKGRFRKDGSVAVINGSSIPEAVLGVMVLWFGWIGFNGGSTLAMNDQVAPIIVRTTLAAAAGMMGALALGWPIMKKPDVNLVLNGSLAGLVAITASCFAVTELESIIIGVSGAWIMMGLTWLLEKLKIDDAVGAIPVHLGCGIWGTLCVALFGDPAILGTGLDFWGQLRMQLFGIGLCAAWSFGVAFVSLFALNKISPLRVTEEQESDGLNKAEHGVTTEIYELYTTLDAQSRTGDISLRAPEEAFTEVGQIAKMYNAVMDKLSETTVEKGAYLNILENVSDGMFLIDADGKIGPSYSLALERIIGRKRLGGLAAVDLILSVVPSAKREGLADYLAACYNKKLLWRNLEKLNPLELVEADIPLGDGGTVEKRLSFSWKRVEKDKRIQSILVLVRDVTAEEGLKQEVSKTKEESRQEIDLLYRLLNIAPDTLREFMAGTKGDFDAINAELQNSQASYQDRLNSVFRRTHAIKGDAALLKLDALAQKAEEIELSIQGLLKKETLKTEDFLSLTLKLGELSQLILRISGIISSWSEYAKVFSADDKAPSHFLGDSLSELAERLAERYGKKARLTLSGDGLVNLSSRQSKALREILAQLTRNAVYHGIESPPERRRQGKPDIGVIAIEAEREGDTLKVRYRDDGGGLDVARIKEKAIAEGIISAERAELMSPADACSLIFREGFSTAGTADDVAGKGIGMSMIRQKVRDLGGRLTIKTRAKEYTEYRMEFNLGQEETNG
jgi:Amt family ammonium transporter